MNGWHLVTAVSAVALVASPHTVPAMTPFLVALTGLLLVICTLPLLGPDRLLHFAVIVSYVIKSFLTFALFYASAWELPVLTSVRLENGFWRFARDAIEYDRLAYLIFRSWQLGTTFPELGPERGQLFYVAGVYYLLGPHPLHVALLNASYAALSVVIVVMTLRHVTQDRRAMRAVALLMAFWPSLIIWSTQMLKDPVVLFLLLSEIYLLVALWSAPAVGRACGARRWILAITTAFTMQFFRDYLSAAFVAAVMVGFGLVVFFRERFRVSRRLLRPAVFVLVVSTATVLGMNLNLVNVLRPRHPELAHMRLGLAYQRERNYDRAAEEYAAAISARPDYTEAYRNLAIAMELNRDPERGLHYLRLYAARGVPAADAEIVRAEIARLELVVAGRLEPSRPSLASVDVRGQALPATGGAVAASSDGGKRSETTEDATRGDWELWARFQLNPTKLHVLERANPAYLGAVRGGMMREGGTSLVDREVKITTAWEAIRYLPRGLSIVLLAPFPWEWRPVATNGALSAGGAGPLKAFAGVEALIMVVLTPAMLIAGVGVVRNRTPLDMFLAVFVILLAVAFAIAIPNVGTLFRLRLQMLFPLLILLATTGSISRTFDLLPWVLRRRQGDADARARTSDTHGSNATR